MLINRSRLDLLILLEDADGLFAQPVSWFRLTVVENVLPDKSLIVVICPLRSHCDVSFFLGLYDQ